MKKPSESFLMFHRVITFLDEWLFYSVLLLLYFNGVMTSNPVLFWSVVGVGATFILISYFKMWGMEELTYGEE